MPSFNRRKKKNRFSRLVADHIQSPKHGGSLVVETGFPTSLIDLYVRNRGRFRKSAVNDKDLEVDSTLTSFSSCSTSDLLSSDLDFRESDEIIIEEDVFYDVVGDSSCIVTSDDRNVEVENSGETDSNVKVKNSGEIEVEMSDEMGKLNPVMVVVLKVLLMFVLALGTKGFTVGITVSAFVLFLLEYLGKSLLVRSSLSADPKTLIESGCNEKKDDESLKKENRFNEVLEIKEVIDESKIRSEKESDEVRSEVVMEIRQKSSRRAIMKSKMKKLVPKKLRKSMGSKDDLASEFKEEESVKRLQDIRPLVLSSECSYSSNEDLCILNQEQDKFVEIEGRRSSSSTLSSEIDCNVKELGRESQQNSGHLALCLIVLVGLIGGRVMAVVLSLSWCLMLKKSQWINCKASQFLI